MSEKEGKDCKWTLTSVKIEVHICFLEQNSWREANYESKDKIRNKYIEEIYIAWFDVCSIQRIELVYLFVRLAERINHNFNDLDRANIKLLNHRCSVYLIRSFYHFGFETILIQQNSWF